MQPTPFFHGQGREAKAGSAVGGGQLSILQHTRTEATVPEDLQGRTYASQCWADTKVYVHPPSQILCKSSPRRGAWSSWVSFPLQSSKKHPQGAARQEGGAAPTTGSSATSGAPVPAGSGHRRGRSAGRSGSSPLPQSGTWEKKGGRRCSTRDPQKQSSPHPAHRVPLLPQESPFPPRRHIPAVCY